MKTLPIPFLVALLALSFIAGAQEDPSAKASLRDTFSKDPVLFLKVASKQMKWEEAAQPLHIAGPIYFVGTKGLASYLITSPQGHILLYTGMPSSGPMIEQSIKKLGFNPKDIKILLTGHAHSDHVGGHAYIKELSGARVAIMDAEKELIESGGKSDFHYGEFPPFYFTPVKVDQVLHDRDTIKLGNMRMTALYTPGHTKGGTTWIMDIVENGRTYNVVFPDGTSINPGYRIAVNPSYPGIQANYERTLSVLERLTPDIWLSSHTEFFRFEEKASGMGKNNNPFIDPKGYKQNITEARSVFDTQVKKEQAEPKK